MEKAKIYLLKVDNGYEYPEEYEAYDIMAFATEEQAKQKVEECKKDEKFLAEYAYSKSYIEDMCVWYEELDLIK